MQNYYVRIWNAKTGDLLDVLNLTGRVADLAFSPNDKLLATAGSNDTIARVWNFAQKTWVAIITQHRSGVESVAFTPDSRFVITAGRDGRALMSGTGAGFEGASLAGHSRPLEGAGVALEGRDEVAAPGVAAGLHEVDRDARDRLGGLGAEPERAVPPAAADLEKIVLEAQGAVLERPVADFVKR